MIRLFKNIIANWSDIKWHLRMIWISYVEIPREYALKYGVTVTDHVKDLEIDPVGWEVKNVLLDNYQDEYLKVASYFLPELQVPRIEIKRSIHGFGDYFYWLKVFRPRGIRKGKAKP